MAISASVGLGTLVEFSPSFPLDSYPSSFNPIYHMPHMTFSFKRDLLIEMFCLLRSCLILVETKKNALRTEGQMRYMVDGVEAG